MPQRPRIANSFLSLSQCTLDGIQDTMALCQILASAIENSIYLELQRSYLKETRINLFACLLLTLHFISFFKQIYINFWHFRNEKSFSRKYRQTWKVCERQVLLRRSFYFFFILVPLGLINISSLLTQMVLSVGGQNHGHDMLFSIASNCVSKKIYHLLAVPQFFLSTPYENSNN